MDIEQALIIVKRRPGMYIRTPNIRELRHFIGGFLFNNIECGRKYPMDINFKRRFHDWARQRIEERRGVIFDLDVGYDDYIEAVCENGEQEMTLFFELCEEFFEEMRNYNGEDMLWEVQGEAE